MSGANGAKGFRCALTPWPDARMVEFVAFASTMPIALEALSAGALAPGSMRRAADGRPAALHFAPGRWLLPDPDAELDAWLTNAAASGIGAAVEVEGKWMAMALDGPDAARLLSSTIDAAAVLESRDCAAVALFDCPAVLATSAQGYIVYVQSSYAADFKSAVMRLCA
jgi:heterotetrameric sarcosine oxidase gamma subunit